LPASTVAWLEAEARKQGLPKTAVARGLIERGRQSGRRSALDLAGDLCGILGSGKGDLSFNKKHLKGFGKSRFIGGSSTGLFP